MTYKLRKRTNSNPDMTLENCIFGAVKITKDVNTSNYNYSGYGIGFDARNSFSFGNNITAKNIIIFGVDMSFSSHKTNPDQGNIYVLGKDFVQGINGTTLYVEKLYTLDFTQQDKRFVLSLHYGSDNSHLFKAKDSDISRNLLALGNISTEFSTTNTEKTGLFGNVHDFSVDYWPIDTGKIRDIHRYMMKKELVI